MPTDAPFIVAIPARYGSTRLPGKPLLPIAGEPMVVHVARRARAAGAVEVVVATDDARIKAALAHSGVRVAMTRADHASGSDRLAEVATMRSEEHTSELQSHVNLVCRLLLEKKKKKNTRQ